MKLILFGISALGLMLGAMIGGTGALESADFDRATGLPLPAGYCALDPTRGPEAEILKTSRDEAFVGGLLFISTLAACDELAAWRQGEGALLRLTSYFEVSDRGAKGWGFDDSVDQPWRSDLLSAALESRLEAVMAGRPGGDIGLQARIGAARYRVALEPVEIPELGLRFVGVTLAGILDRPESGPPLFLVMSEPYRDPGQVLALLDLQRESLGRVRQVRAEQRLLVTAR